MIPAFSYPDFPDPKIPANRHFLSDAPVAGPLLFHSFSTVPGTLAFHSPHIGYTQRQVRKLSAAVLVILFSVSLITPLLASAPEDNLPACCRRDGKHACAMRKAATAPQPGPGFSAKPTFCSQYPLSQSIPSSPTALPVITAARQLRIAPTGPLATSPLSTFAHAYLSASNPRAPPSSLLP